jgi:MoaA/NifB/PqqE/SkfB family radical SAM enzyme
VLLPPLQVGGAPLPLVGCGVRPPHGGHWARCTPAPLALDALDGGPRRLAVVLRDAGAGASTGEDTGATTRQLEQMVGRGEVQGAELIVPARTLRALAEHNPSWTGRRGALRVLGVNRAARPWGGRWDLERLAVYDGGCGRRVNDFDGSGFAVIEVRVDGDVEAANPDDAPFADGPGHPPAHPFLDIVTWEDGRVQIIVRPTPVCDLRCPHCFVTPFEAPTAGELTRALAEAEADGVAASARQATLVLSGGEPLLCADLGPVVRWAKQRPGVRLGLQTSATQVVRRRGTLEALIGAGLRDVLVNLPAFDVAVYQEMTGGVGRVDEALAGVDLLVDLGLRVTLNVVLTRSSASVVAETIYRAHERWGNRVRMTLSTLSPSTPGGLLSDNGVAPADIRAVYERALRAAADRGIELVVGGGDCTPPACLLPPEVVTGDSWFMRAAAELRLLADGELPRPGVRYKIAACACCRFDARCPGVAGAHAAASGLQALSPVP